MTTKPQTKGHTMNKHTPGPWNVDDQERGDGDAIAVFPSVGGVCICEVVARSGEGRSNPIIQQSAEANASLIAAAPELLDELIAAYLRAHPCPTCGGVEVLGGGLARCSCCDQPWAWDQFTPTPEWQSSRAAIAKATGGSNE